MQELIGYYITMEEYFMRETVNKVGLVALSLGAAQHRKGIFQSKGELFAFVHLLSNLVLTFKERPTVISCVWHVLEVPLQPVAPRSEQSTLPVIRNNITWEIYRSNWKNFFPYFTSKCSPQ